MTKRKREKGSDKQYEGVERGFRYEIEMKKQIKSKVNRSMKIINIRVKINKIGKGHIVEKKINQNKSSLK